jgi:hypothetical protein
MLGMEANNNEMLKWCRADLAASKATWKIVVYHKPSYDHGHRYGKWGRKTLLPLFRKHKVDLVLSGHAHGYVRLHPMYTRGENDNHPITHIISAGAGASIRSTLLPEIPHMAAQTRQHHYMVFTVDKERIEGKAISKTGETLDTFSIVKSDGKYGPDHLSKAVDERSFDTEVNLVKPKK